MPIYTVHEPPAKWKDKRRGPENFRFVRDGFHFWAFVLPPLWMLRHRLWLVLIGYLAVAIGMGFGLRALGAPNAAMFGAQVLLAFLVGLEAGSLRRWTLRRRKWEPAGLVSADNLEAAERRFFDVWSSGAASISPPASPLPAAAVSPYPSPVASRPAGTNSDILGLFPKPGTQR